MSKVGKGVPPPAKLQEIIKDLFENEKIKNSDNTCVFVLFSRAHLTESQKKTLVYPQGLTPINYYIVYQTDYIDEEGDIYSTVSQIVSFATKCDGFIYGYYFNLINQERLSVDQLTNSEHSVKFCNEVEFIFSDYVEVYHNVIGTTVILGLSSGTDTELPSASLQYTDKSKYYYDELDENGIKDPNYPKTRLLGLSNNLALCN